MPSARGASIIIARGLQASMIKQYTDVPVVEIVATAQEMALLVKRADQILKKERPFIAAVGFKNMFCDMQYFDSIYNIKLRTYFAPHPSALRETALRAIEEGAELLIGGDVAVETAKEAGLPSPLLVQHRGFHAGGICHGREHGLRYGCTEEKQCAAGGAFGLLLQRRGEYRPEGRITAANPVMMDILGRDGQETVGKRLPEVFSDIDREKFQQILQGKEESFASFMDASGTPVFAILAPVRVGRRDRGSHPHLPQGAQAEGGAAAGRGESRSTLALWLRGTLAALVQKSRSMQECIRLARLYAQAKEPILILGEEGTERRLLAEGDP